MKASFYMCLKTSRLANYTPIAILCAIALLVLATLEIKECNFSSFYIINGAYNH